MLRRLQKAERIAKTTKIKVVKARKEEGAGAAAWGGELGHAQPFAHDSPRETNKQRRKSKHKSDKTLQIRHFSQVEKCS